MNNFKFQHMRPLTLLFPRSQLSGSQLILRQRKWKKRNEGYQKHVSL